MHYLAGLADLSHVPVTPQTPLPVTSAGGAGSVVGAGTAATAQRTTQASDSPLVVSTGSIADAAATDSTSSWSLVALLKGLLAQMLSSAPAQIYKSNSYLGITTQATTVVKSGAGTLDKIVINKTVASGVITIYDNTAGSGTVIATITNPAVLLQEGPIPALYECAFATGLTIVTSGAAQDITVIYR